MMKMLKTLHLMLLQWVTNLQLCLQLEKFSSFPKTNKRVYRYRFVPFLFDVCCICREAFMVMLNKMTDILWQTAAVLMLPHAVEML